MSELSKYPDELGCGLCTHKVNRHNRIVGCEDCDCMATPGEANLDRAWHKAAPVHYKKPPRSEAPYTLKYETGVGHICSGLNAEIWDRRTGHVAVYTSLDKAQTILEALNKEARNG